MRRLLRWFGALAVLGLGGWTVSGPIGAYWKERQRIHYREAEVSRGRITAVVNATGTVKPVRTVLVGSFVSGPIESIFVDFNDEVSKGQVLAKIDPTIYKANVARDAATLGTKQAEVKRVSAQLQQARNNEQRSLALRAENKSFISDQEMDQFRFTREALEADLAVAHRSVEQAQGSLQQSTANLGYTDIISPVDGTILERKIDPGQTVQSQFQTPELFTVAPDMRTEMRVFASVDESDIGHIRGAQETDQPVRFTVDAYPDDLFEGRIYQIRKSSTTTQNVVTYPVVVSAPNPALKLLPGMTATISFQLSESSEVLRIPNAALRFYPQREQVHPDHQHILEARPLEAGELEAGANDAPSAAEKAERRRQRKRRHVWVLDGDRLRALEVITGMSNSSYTELASGELRAGQKLVTGVKAKK
jgi:HlyD family secretion protein